MKKYLLIFLFISSYTFSQSNGITYQAVIYNPRGEQLPGANNPYSLITNQQVCIQFGIVDANGSLEYQENVQVVTDGFGMVNVLIGAYTQTAGYATGFNNVNWGPEAKFLKVDIAIKGECAEFEELSYQPFTYVPFAYYSPASDIPGPQGIQGEVGPQGATGATGPQGSAGTNGTNGADGATGATGPQGSTGLTGPQGSPGINGENGQDGINGLSAYEIWISLGNTGTEQEFIDSLVGPASSGGNSGSANFTNGIPSSIDEYTSCNDEDSCNLLIQDGWVPFGGISIDESRAGTGGNTYSYGVRQAMIKYENSPTIDAYRIAVSIQEVTDDIADGFIPYGGVSYTESRAGTGGRNFSKKEYQAMILLSSENENTNDSSSSSDSIVAEHISPIEDYNWDIPGWEFDAMGEGTSLIKSRITNNSITFYPIFVSKQTDYSALGFFRGSSSNNTSNVNNIDIRIGIFSFSNGKPGELVKEFDLINYSTLPRFFEVETFFSLNAGNYFVGVTSETQGLQSYSDFYNVVRNANEGQTFGISPNGTLSKMSVVNGSSYLETGDSYIYSKNSSQVGFGNIDSANFIQMTNSGFIFFKQVL